MKGLRILLSGLVSILCIGSDLYAQAIAPATATGEIFAEIIPVFSAEQTAQLNFGKFSPGPQGGEIILSPQNTISVMGSIYRGNGTHNAASFYVSGDQDATYSISLPSGPVIIKNTSGSKTMLIDNWVSVPLEGVGTGLLQNGAQTVFVGATLKVGTLNENPVGLYTGSYLVTFDFN